MAAPGGRAVRSSSLLAPVPVPVPVPVPLPLPGNPDTVPDPLGSVMSGRRGAAAAAAAVPVAADGADRLLTLPLPPAVTSSMLLDCPPTCANMPPVFAERAVTTRRELSTRTRARSSPSTSASALMVPTMAFTSRRPNSHTWAPPPPPPPPLLLLVSTPPLPLPPLLPNPLPSNAPGLLWCEYGGENNEVPDRSMDGERIAPLAS